MTKQQIAEQRAKMIASGNLLIFTRAEAVTRASQLANTRDPEFCDNDQLRAILGYYLRNNVEIEG